MDVSSKIDDLLPIYLVDHICLSRPSGSQRIGVSRVSSDRMNAPRPESLGRLIRLLYRQQWIKTPLVRLY